MESQIHCTLKKNVLERVSHVLSPIWRCIYLDKTLGFGQKTERRMSRSFRAKWYQHFQLFEAISEVCSPAIIKKLMGLNKIEPSERGDIDQKVYWIETP